MHLRKGVGANAGPFPRTLGPRRYVVDRGNPDSEGAQNVWANQVQPWSTEMCWARWDSLQWFMSCPSNNRKSTMLSLVEG
jgi:hypothetical protein